MSHQYSAKTQEQNRLRGERLLLLMETFNLRNCDFEHLNDPFRNDEISEFKKGKRTLTEESAKRILSHPSLSDVRLSWLMGYDRYMTNAEAKEHDSIARMINDFEKDKNNKLRQFNIILSFYGYEVKDSWKGSSYSPPKSSDEATKLLETHYQLLKEGKVIKEFSIGYLESLQKDIGSILEIILSRI